ncbi:MAG: HAD-IC family P-type ATPase, partial [Candidatus Uhrbacteria bacterium]|nr:HAD-IC family P-type ATPase [Candidatus Uhrbacteria bacterium]
PSQDALSTLESSRAGLAVDEARTRLKKYGLNVLNDVEPTSHAQIFFRQFASPFTLILLVAVVAGAYLHEWVEAGLVVVIILLNSFLGYYQEQRADRALLALKQYLPQQARVRRSGTAVDIASRDVVPGDIMLVRAGDRVMADARVLSNDSLTVDEAALTGESQPVAKASDPVAPSTEVFGRSSLIFAGTTVASGGAEALVIATGEHTQFGSIAELAAASNQEETPFQRELRGFSRSIARAAAVLCAVIFIIGIVAGSPAVVMISLAASLAVAIVPEGLQVAMTVILSVGMQRMLKRRVLVRSLAAVETLGGVHVLCVDKTGTLTTGHMSVTELHAGINVATALGTQAEPLLEALYVLTVDDSSPTFTVAAIRNFFAAQPAGALHPSFPVLADVPFSPTLRYSARVVADGANRRAFMFGAPDAILSRADMSDENALKAHQLVDDMTNRGLRTLAVADASVSAEDVMAERGPHDVHVLGFIGLSDPIRASVAPSVAAARRAGIRTIMITGDHPETARNIAQEAGILTPDCARVMTGSELATIGDVELSQRMQETAVFARVLPEQKLRIVRTLQSHNFVVAMTGDGMNDAPALRAADVGIAVGHATDVARETADVVLLDSDFSTIVAAVEEGRAVFENIRKQIGFLLSLSLGE